MRRSSFALGTAAALALGPSRRRANAAVDSTQIRFAYQATVWGAVAMVADDLGAWAKYGAKVDSLRLTAGAAVRDGMMSGSIDGGSVGVTPLIVGAARANLQAVAVNAYTGKTLAVVVRKDSKYQTVADLRGAKIASTLGSATNEGFVDKVGPKFGLSKDDYQLVNIAFQDMPAALQTGQVDAFLGTEPYPAFTVYGGYGRILTDYSKYDYAPVFVVFRGAYLREHRDNVIAAMRSWLDVVALHARNRARFDQVLYDDFNKHGSSIPLAVIKEASARLETIPQYRPDLRAYMHEQAQVLIKQNAIPSEPDWNTVLRTDILAAAQRAR